jgi:hypothetical protein
MSPNAAKKQLLALLKHCDESMYSIAEYSRKPLKAPRTNHKNYQGGFIN